MVISGITGFNGIRGCRHRWPFQTTFECPLTEQDKALALGKQGVPQGRRGPKAHPEVKQCMWASQRKVWAGIRTTSGLGDSCAGAATAVATREDGGDMARPPRRQSMRKANRT